MRYISQKLFQEIFISVDHLQPGPLRVLFQCIKSLLIFLVWMNVGIKKIANSLIPYFFHPFEGINGTVGTTDMEKDLHLNRHHCENLPLPLFSKEGNCPSLWSPTQSGL
jgi:hypothetical protein